MKTEAYRKRINTILIWKLPLLRQEADAIENTADAFEKQNRAIALRSAAYHKEGGCEFGTGS